GIEAETVQVFRNLSEILKAAGLSFSHVVRVDIFTTDMSSFMQINKIYAKYFKKDPKPARQTVEVTKLPKKARIEVSCIAHLD
ncbi:MAG: RidA family protein, partial [Candidatus Paceibacterota bacterium]